MNRVNALIELIKYLWTGRTKKQRAYSAAILAGCDDDKFQRWYRKNVDKHAKFVSPFENTPDQYNEDCTELYRANGKVTSNNKVN